MVIIKLEKIYWLKNYLNLLIILILCLKLLLINENANKISIQ